MTKKILVWGLIAMLVLLLAGGFALYKGYKDMLEDFHKADPHKTEGGLEGGDKTIKEKMQDPFVLLLYGIDQRDSQGDKGRPDTLMLALIDPVELKVSLVSIPRDSYVEIPGHRNKDKINHSFPLGGVDLTIQTIEEWLDIPIKGYVAIDFNGFIEIVDLVGGVEVDVDRSIRYHDPMDGTRINLDKGIQVLDGKNTLDFVRARLDDRGPRYYTSDYLRMERQQNVLKSLGKELVSVSSLTRIFSMMNVLGDNVSTNLTPKELDYLVRKFYRFDMENLETTSIVGEALNMRGVWYEDVPEEEVARVNELVHNFLERKPVPVVQGEEQDSEQAEKEKEKEEESNN